MKYPYFYEDIDPLIHSWRWVQAYPFLARAEVEIWRDDFDPVAKWVKRPDHKPLDYLGALHDNLTFGGRLVGVVRLKNRTTGEAE